jgi:hypothetical protein
MTRYTQDEVDQAFDSAHVAAQAGEPLDPILARPRPVASEPEPPRNVDWA